MSFPARSVFNSSCQITASNNGYFSVFRAQVFSEQRLASNRPVLQVKVNLVYVWFTANQFVLSPSSLLGLSIKHRFQHLLLHAYPLPGNMFTEPLPSNGFTGYNRLLIRRESAHIIIISTCTCICEIRRTYKGKIHGAEPFEGVTSIL
jgi:hypothetical protein